MLTKRFFDDNVLLTTSTAKELYELVKDLPIVDYHCHLNERDILEDKRYDDIGELWLGGDHYKWRAMRLCGVDEKYITGDASWEEKFLRFAEIMPNLAGNPLYYFSHLELKTAFGITEPLNLGSSERIRKTVNEKLKSLSARKLLELYKVEFVGTTDDPMSDLKCHGKYGDTLVSPTFRPDKALETGVVDSALLKRLDLFVSKGCKLSDHGMDFAPAMDKADVMEKLAGEYRRRNMTMQLHMGTMRNINTTMFGNVGKDSGFDVFRANLDTDALAVFLNRLNSNGNLPRTIIYTLNPNALPAICAISGAFKNVRVGAAWWFNDTLEGIRQHISVLSEYGVLGTFLGMLTDSRSFLSYARFDFFRRILADYLGNLVVRGEYDLPGAKQLMEKICYTNIKEFCRI